MTGKISAAGITDWRPVINATQVQICRLLEIVAVVIPRNTVTGVRAICIKRSRSATIDCCCQCLQIRNRCNQPWIILCPATATVARHLPQNFSCICCFVCQCYRWQQAQTQHWGKQNTCDSLFHKYTSISNSPFNTYFFAITLPCLQLIFNKPCVKCRYLCVNTQLCCMKMVYTDKKESVRDCYKYHWHFYYFQPRANHTVGRRHSLYHLGR